MWVYFVRDECERLVKNQASKDEQMDFAIGSRVSCEKQPAKKQCVERMTERCRVMLDYNFCDCFMGEANLQRTYESLYLVKSYVLLYQVFTHTIYTLITHSL